MKQKMCINMLMLAICWTASLAFKLSGSNAPIKFSDSHNETSNKIIEEVVSENLQADMKDIHGIPNPMGDNESENNETNEGFGDLAKNLEFLLLKVVQLETVAEMHEARIETQQLQIDEHRKVIEAQQKEIEALKGEGREGGPTGGLFLEIEHKDAQTRLSEAQNILTTVIKKHTRQRETRKFHEDPESEVEEPEVELAGEGATSQQSSSTDESVSWPWKHRRRRWNPVHIAKSVADTMSDGYNAAKDKAKWLAENTINTVEVAIKVLSNGFSDFGASCPHRTAAGFVNFDMGNGLRIRFGSFNCKISLIGQSTGLFGFDLGTHQIPFPSELRAIGHVGWDLAHHCAGHHNHLTVGKCLARLLAEKAPPLDFLPEQVRKVTDGRINELFPGHFGILGHIGWEVMHHCPGHHNHIEVTKCLARSLAKYAPPFDFLPDHFKVFQHVGFEVIHNCGTNHNHVEVTKCLASSVAKYAGTDFLPGPMKALAGGDLPLSFLPGPVQVLAGGKLSTIIECAQPNSHGDLIKCLGSKIIASVPPLNFLNRLGDIFTEFIEVFAKVASTVATSAMKEGQSLLQIAAASEFPAAGAPPQVHHRGANLLISTHSERAPSARPSSFLQKGDDEKPPAAVSFSFEDYGPEAHTLVTQFQGRETSTGSCLAFAPKNMTGSNNQATEADWKAKSEDDFVELKPWAVPCGNQWMKTKWDKWQGYSMYTSDLSIEKCLTVKFQVNMQPVVAFVGGIQFDLLPGPLAEVDTTVCWPRGQPEGLDLSVLRTVIKSNGVMLFSRTLRLSKRFGDNTDFVEGNINKAHQTMRSFFGVNAAPGESGTGIASMERSSLLQANQSAKAKEELEEALWETQDDLYFASIEYGKDLGVNITSELGGHAAQEQLEALLAKKEKNEEAEDKDEAEEKEEVEETFKLFSFKNPGMISFEVQGLLHGNWLQLGLQMAFGPYESPHMKIPLLNLADQFAAILAALPSGLVSVESRAKAIASLKDFSSKDVKKVKAKVPKLIPGTTIGLRNPHWGRYMRMNNAIMDTSSPQGLDFPAGWEFELFTVVDAGNGEVAFHNPRWNRFVWMEGATCVATHHHPAAGYSRDWAKARFMEVAAGDNTIALYNKAEGRFLRLHNTIMDSSPPVSSEFPAGWAFERFQIVPTGPYGGIKPGMVVALYNTHWKRFIRMHQTYMDASAEHPPHLANKAGYPAGWTWEQFTVVDGGNGNIALHSAIHNRFVSMRSGTALGASSPMAANALPTNWYWERFAVVPGGHLEIALHNHTHNSFVTLVGTHMGGHVANAEAYIHGWAYQRFKVVPLGEVDVEKDASWSFDFN